MGVVDYDGNVIVPPEYQKLNMHIGETIMQWMNLFS